MNDYKRLRKAAQSLIDGVDPLLVPWREIGLWRELRDALAATPEESEMERLKVWLGERVTAECDAVEAHLRQPGRELAEHQGRRSAYVDVLQEIGADLGYGEGRDAE